MRDLAPFLAAWLVLITMMIGIWVGWTLCSFFGSVLPWLTDEDREVDSDDA